MKLLKTTVFVLFTILANAQNPFQPPRGKVLVQTDLHTHSVFSDGQVWPDIRVEEALKEGLDLLAITEHLEYQPHRQDIPHPDRNRAYHIAQERAQNQEKLSVINGAEITRAMAPGHINAVFIKDANTLLHKDSLSGIVEANRQKGFVFWNHPTWDGQRPDGIARLEPFHRYLIKENLLHGIEVVNEVTYSEEAFQIALDNNLTILGTSDIHGLTNWLFEIDKGGHRPTTFVLSPSADEKEVKEALFQAKTVVWFKDILLGKQEHIQAVLQENLVAKAVGYGPKNKIAEIVLENKSALPMILSYEGEYSFYRNSRTIRIPAYESITLGVKTVEKVQKVALDFTIENVLTGPQKPAKMTFNVVLH